jgi:hypothetical protein
MLNVAKMPYDSDSFQAISKGFLSFSPRLAGAMGAPVIRARRA